MSDAKTERPFDPLEPWRDMRDAYMSAWSKSMIEAVNSNAYAEATGTMLDTYLAASGPFREAAEKAMTETLQHLSMPSRQDVTSIAERLTNLEIRLDDMDASLQRIEGLLRAQAGPKKSERARPDAAPLSESTAGREGKGKE